MLWFCLSLHANLDKLLLEQKKDDFKFKDEATEYSSDPTKVLLFILEIFVHNSNNFDFFILAIYLLGLSNMC